MGEREARKSALLVFNFNFFLFISSFVQNFTVVYAIICGIFFIQDNNVADFRIFAKEALNDFIFMLDGDAHLTTPETLQLLVETAVAEKLYDFFYCDISFTRVVDCELL